MWAGQERLLGSLHLTVYAIYHLIGPNILLKVQEVLFNFLLGGPTLHLLVRSQEEKYYFLKFYKKQTAKPL